MSNDCPSSTATLWALRATAIDANTGTQLPFQGSIPWAAQATASTNSRFLHGAPGEVAIVTSSVTGVNNFFRLTIPAASLVALEIPLTR